MKLITALLAITLVGCANLEAQNLRRELANQPSPYVDGYIDGCTSGRSTGNSLRTFTKNVQRFANENYYQQGWNDGFKVCEADEARMNRAIRR